MPTIEYCCEDTDSAAVNINTCSLTVTKDVTCDDPADPGAVFDPDLVTALPGASIGFAFDVCNTGSVNLPIVSLEETLSCAWPVGGFAAYIGATDVTPCVCPGGTCTSADDLDGAKNLDACLSGGIPTNGCLTITFQAQVPPGFDAVGTPLDCKNTIEVQGQSDICAAGDGTSACPPAIDTAGINVVVPDVDCSESICADYDVNGTCDSGPTDDLMLGCDVNDSFPLALLYSFSVGNPGETALATADACKPGFVQAAVDAGIAVGPCDLCTGACDGIDDDCAEVGPIPPGGTGVATCRLVIPDRAAWDAFAASDGGSPNCHSNGMMVTGFVDTTGLCAMGADTSRDTMCGAEACIAPSCDLEVEKTFRCVDNCLGDSPGASVASLPALPGATVEFEVVARNAGAVGADPLCSLNFADTLEGPFEICPDACVVQVINGNGDPVCTGAPALTTNGFNYALDLQAACGVLLDPGDEVVIRCTGTIPDDAPAGITSNSVTVMAASECPTTGPLYCCEDDGYAEVNVGSCGMVVTKRVTCDDPADPAAVFDDAMVDALPGATIGFSFNVCNTGTVELPTLELNDMLTCDGWFVPLSVQAFIGAVNVTDCVCPPGGCTVIGDLNGTKDLAACLPGGIPPEDCATISFEVRVPADYAAKGTTTDCLNMITVQGRSAVCANPDANPCPIDLDTAAINVLVPELACDKQVCADINNDGDCADPGAGAIPADIPFTSSLNMACDVNGAFPIRLIYRFINTNGGETDLLNAQACDANLVADALAAGATVGPCDLCTGACDGIDDTCADLGTIPAGGLSMATCEIVFPTVDSWDAFAAADGGLAECHDNTVNASADVDTTGLCHRDAVTELMSTCGAQACLSPPCGLDVSKQFHCIESCADRTPISADTNALQAIPGAAVEFEIHAVNAGAVDDPSICRLRFTDTLDGPFIPCADFCEVEIPGRQICPLPANWLPIDGSAVELDLPADCGGPLAPGEEVVIRCAGTIDPNAAGTDVISNGLVVEGATVCPPSGDITYCCDADTNAEVMVDTCAFMLVKQVACDNGVLGKKATILPGGEAEFQFDVCNTGELAIPRVDVLDALSCPSWYRAGSATCTIGGTDVTSCVCPPGGCVESFDLNGLKDLDACLPGGIPPGACMTCTFDVDVPPDFDAAGEAVDCTNIVRVSAFNDVCGSSPNNPCDEHEDRAEIDVVVPSIECAKTVCADMNNDGDCTDPGDFDEETSFEIPAAATFPLSITYTFMSKNTGDTDIVNAKVCDPELVDDALAAGASFGPCHLCTGACDGTDDTCANLGTIASGGMEMRSCSIIFNNRTQLETFMQQDNDGNDYRYINTCGTMAEVDTTGLCSTPLDSLRLECGTEFGIEQVIPPVCYPLTKATFTIWNQNEVKLTGLHHCIKFWDQTPFALYGNQLHAPNHLLRANLQTDKGKARIDGMSSALCTDEVLESEPAPLIGVSQKLLYFNGSPTALTGIPLTGMGAESGHLRYDIGIGAPERPEAASTDTSADDVLHRTPVAAVRTADDDVRQAAMPLPAGTPVGAVGEKGSLLVFPRVELRWSFVNNNWVLTQDTFIELTNDFPDPVVVQMYFVNGDKPLAALPNERAHPGCNWVDVEIDLTASQPTYWSAYTGQPEGVSPFTILDPGTPPGRPADDGSGDRVLRGYVLAWAVRYVNVGGVLEQHEIAWNHLTGAVTIVNYGIGDAWAYTPWAFPTVSAPHGTEPDGQPGNLNLDGVEYVAPPDLLLLDFYGDGASTFSINGTSIQTESDITLLPLLQDLRQR